MKREREMSTQTRQPRESIREFLHCILAEGDHNEPSSMPKQDDIIKRGKRETIDFDGQFNA